jgi:undecaprenyl-diphosphatase
MIEQLVELDQKLFFAINHGLANPFFDWLMPILRNRYSWAPLYLFWIIFFPKNYGKKGMLIILFLLITFAITDTVSSNLIKHAVQRLRPCNDPGLKAAVRSLIPCGTGFSFPSSHAASHFSLAVFLITIFYHKWKWILLLGTGWAGAISLAQVYVGVHYPIDILTGALLGSMVGYMTGSIFLAFQKENTWKPGN